MILGHGLGPGGRQHQHAGDLADRLAQLLEMRPRFEHIADRALVEPIGEFAGEAVVILAAADGLVSTRIQQQLIGPQAVVECHPSLLNQPRYFVDDAEALLPDGLGRHLVDDFAMGHDIQAIAEPDPPRLSLAATGSACRV